MFGFRAVPLLKTKPNCFMKKHNGDDGMTETRRGGGRVSKASPCVHLLGDLDELNAFLGAAVLALPDSCADIRRRIVAGQEFLFVVGGVLYGGCGDAEIAKIREETRVLGEESERLADETGRRAGFEAPGGNAASVALDIARTVCRRAERSAVASGDAAPDLTVWLNRFSDYLHNAARAAKVRG